MNRKQKILSSLKSHLNKHLNGIVKDVILFGSQAKGTELKDSDYDILLILNKEINSKDETKILDLCYDIDLQYNILIDLHILSNSELDSARGKQPIFSNAINSGIYA